MGTLVGNTIRNVRSFVGSTRPVQTIQSWLWRNMDSLRAGAKGLTEFGDVDRIIMNPASIIPNY